jgi:fructosamine-3-kinase
VIARAASTALGRRVERAERIAGGDLNTAWRLELEGGARAFVKARDGAAPGEYAAEAAGLRWLGEAGGLRVPEVLAAESGFLVLEWLDERPLDPEAFGRGLALTHAAGAGAFGEPPPGAPEATFRLGPLSLPAAIAPDWPALYGEHRLAPLLRLAVDRGAIGAAGAGAVEAVIARLPALCGPAEPPARLHGDLWMGNVVGPAGVIDPAAHGGHREVDLAMLRLFGAPDPRLFAAYGEVHPLAEGHEARVPLFQLLPLLVHAVLFGGSYGAAAERAARVALK